MRGPLWLKLTLAGLLVEALMLSLLVISNVRLTEEELISKTQLRINSAIPLLNAALATPLMQRDYGALHEILAEARGNDAYVYLALLDKEGRRIAASGITPAQPLPALDRSLGAEHGLIFDTETAIRLAGTEYGRLRFGIATEFLIQARDRAVRQGIYVGLAAVVMTFLTLALIGYWLTRRLQQLTHASHALADQNFDALLPASGPDEVGQLATAFRAMSHQLKTQLSELKDSEQRFFAIANYTYDLELWIDPSGRAIWVNPSVTRMTGYAPDECLTLPGFPLCLIDAADRSEAETHFQARAARRHRRGLSVPHAAQGWLALLGGGELALHLQPRRPVSRHTRQHSRHFRTQGFRSKSAGISGRRRSRTRASASPAVGDESGHSVHRRRSPRDLPQPRLQPHLAAARRTPT